MPERSDALAEQIIPEQMVTLLDQTGLALGLRPPWIPEQNQRFSCFRDHEDLTPPDAPTEAQIAELSDLLKRREKDRIKCF